MGQVMAPGGDRSDVETAFDCLFSARLPAPGLSP
jgi:hypothetical protein